MDLNHSEARSRGSGHLSVTDWFPEDLVNLAGTKATHLCMPFFPSRTVFPSLLVPSRLVISTICIQCSHIFLGGMGPFLQGLLGD